MLQRLRSSRSVQSVGPMETWTWTGPIGPRDQDGPDRSVLEIQMDRIGRSRSVSVRSRPRLCIPGFKVSSKQRDFYKSLDLVEKESIAWVLRVQSGIHNTNRCVLGALPVDERFSHLRTMFEEHLRTLNSDNPLRKLLNSGGIFNSNELLFHL